MSTGFNILISPGDPLTASPGDFYVQLLTLVLNSVNVRREGMELTLYREQRPFNYGPESNDPRIIFKGPLDEGKPAQELAKILRGINTQDVYIGVTCSYDRLRWNNKLCDPEDSVGWLVVEYESPGFDLGQGFRKLGSYRIHFDNKEYFSPFVIDRSRCPATNPEALAKVVRYGANIGWVQSLFREIAAELKPEYLFIVSEGQRVNPVNFHMVYHNKLSGYLFDAQKVLQLHTLGGGYFYEGGCDGRDPAYRKLDHDGSAYSDDIRSAAEARRLAEEIDFLGTLLGDNVSLNLEDVEISEIITSCDEVDAGVVDSSIFMANSKFLFGYLDVAYLKLLDKALAESLKDG